MRLRAALPLVLVVLSPALGRSTRAQEARAGASRYALGFGAAAGAGPFASAPGLPSALGLHWMVAARALSRERPVGFRGEYLGSTPLTFFEATPGCPINASCPSWHGREPLAALIGSVSWGLRADRSGAYVIGGLGGYRTEPPGVDGPAGNFFGASYGAGLAYFERRGKNTFFLEARRHHVRSARVGWFVPVVAGVIF